MSQTSAGVLVERLLDWGVDTIFGLPGDGINGLLEALRQVRDRIRFVHMRHEEAAAFAAVGTRSSAAAWASACRRPGQGRSTC